MASSCGGMELIGFKVSGWFTWHCVWWRVVYRLVWDGSECRWYVYW